jgi:ABC-type thiamine transport system ATPase subunit
VAPEDQGSDSADSAGAGSEQPASASGTQSAAQWAIKLDSVVYEATSGGTRTTAWVHGTFASARCRAIVCPEGASTSLLHVILGLQRPTFGHVWVDDVNITDWGHYRRVVGHVGPVGEPAPLARPKIGFVPATPALLPHLTVERNIRSWCSPNVPIATRNRWNEALRRLADDLGLSPVLGRLPGQLPAQGQRFRVALARAVFNLPAVVVLHVPTSPPSFERLRQLMTRVSAWGGDGGNGLYEPAWLVLTEDWQVIRHLPDPHDTETGA